MSYAVNLLGYLTYVVVKPKDVSNKETNAKEISKL